MKNIKRNVAAVTLALLMALLAFPFFASGKEMSRQQLYEAAKASITTISTAKADDIYKKGGALFLDVREPNEYNSGHIPGAVNIPLGVVEKKIGKTFADKDAVILVYCRTGHRSTIATSELKKLGFTHLLNIDGGMQAWTKAGYPVQ